MAAKATLAQLPAGAAGLCYLQGTSRGRRRERVGMGSVQRSHLPPDKEEECGGVMRMDDREGRGNGWRRENIEKQNEKRGRSTVMR